MATVRPSGGSEGGATTDAVEEDATARRRDERGSNHGPYALSARSLRLDPVHLIRTIERLRDRIQERFPGSGLGGLAQDLLDVARLTTRRVEWVARPHVPLRIGAGIVIALILVVLTQLLLGARLSPDSDLAEIVQTLDSALNDVFLIGAAIFFLVTVETRIKRRRALGFLRELRALAHIVDMHQLTKDPERLAGAGTDTPSSPARTLSPFELSRYLDYCSEMLSLTSKVAALYVQNFDDAVVLAAVDEVETLTTDLSGKIWQKIMIIERV